MHLDPVVEPIKAIVNALRQDVILCSGRPATYCRVTRNWLQDNAVNYSTLLMRAQNDMRADDVCKREMLELLMLIYGRKPLFVVDDRQSVVDMWRRHGILCLQARPNPEF